MAVYDNSNEMTKMRRKKYQHDIFRLPAPKRPDDGRQEAFPTKAQLIWLRTGSSRSRDESREIVVGRFSGYDAQVYSTPLCKLEMI